ncbi:MAG: hypothetical protein PHI15_03515 [Methanomicrobium sp.]|nr:hypothetical protein [Methanomicrobium sp.]
MKEVKVKVLKNAYNPGAMPICPDTGRHPKLVASEMNKLLKEDNIEVSYEEKEAEIPKNLLFLITVNDKTLEELVPLPDPSKYCGMSCDSCGGISSSGGSQGCVRGYNEVPESVLRLAIKKAAFL